MTLERDESRTNRRRGSAGSLFVARSGEAPFESFAERVGEAFDAGQARVDLASGLCIVGTTGRDRTTRTRDAVCSAVRDAPSVAEDAWRWMAEPGDPDVAGQGAEFVDLERNLPGGGAVPSRPRVVLRLPQLEMARTPQAVERDGEETFEAQSP